MKKHLILSLLLIFTLFSNLSAQKLSEQFCGTKFSTKSPLLIDHLIKNKQVIEQRMHPLNLKNPNKQLIQQEQFTPGNFQNYKANTDELTYFYDSVFLYTTTGEITKLSSLRDAGGNVLSELNQVWDTVNNNWENSHIRTNTYDGSGNQLSVLLQDWAIEGNQWLNVLKYRFTLDQYGNRITELGQDWSIENNDWVNVARGNYTYDNYGFIISYIGEVWETSISNWIYSKKYTFTYNSFGQQLFMLSQNWGSTNNDWINNERDTRTYDESGNLLSYLFEEWDIEGNTWQSMARYTYSYDASGYMLTEIIQSLDTENNALVNRIKSTFTNDESGNIITQFVEFWDKAYSKWVNDAKGDFTYNSSGKLLTLLIQYWEDANNRWISYSLSSTTYDDSGNELTSVLKMWDQVGWKNNYKFEYQYDYEAKKVVGFYYEWDDNWFPADANIYIAIFDHYFYNEYETSKIEFFYSTGVSAIGDDASSGKNAFTIYPNPAGKTVNVKFHSGSSISGNITLYDAFGKLVKEIPIGNIFPGEYVFPVDVSSLEAGIYLVKLSGGGFYHTRKLVIAK
jgi:hypothetical protein